MNIRQTFGLPAVEDGMLAIRNYKESKDYSIANPDLIVGLELEIEGWNDGFERSFRGFRFETDGSLRNNGIEAVTLPTFSKYVPHLLTSFFKKFEITEDNYSPRCSTHIHVNCQDLTHDNVRTIGALYQMLERVLFGFIGNDRDNNIFCVPWNQCNISLGFVRKFMRDPNYAARTWQKYTAVNIIPLRNYGTLEFRHLEGTCDVQRIVNWLNIIGCLFKYATNTSYKEFKGVVATMNTISNYAAFIDAVFGEYADPLMRNPDFEQLLSVGVVDAKLCMINDETPAENALVRPPEIPRGIWEALVGQDMAEPREMLPEAPEELEF